MSFHDEILTDEQRRLLRTLGPLATSLGYYLAGGTALALRLGHRESVDFDFFSPDAAVRGPAIEVRLQSMFPSIETSSVGDGTFNGAINGVKASFFIYPYGLLEEADVWSVYDVRLVGIRDLAAMKMSAVTGRGTKKDFVDIHALLGEGVRLVEMQAWFCEKYRISDVTAVRRGLAFFDDADLKPMPRMLRPVEWATVRADILRAARSME